MSTPPERILVIGATGMLGRPVAEQLLAAGFAVRALARSPERARSLLPSVVEIAPGDVTDADSIRRAMEGCAGVHINLQGGPDEPSYERVEHQGTRAVALAAQAMGLRQLTAISSYTTGQAADSTPDARAKWQAEQAIRASGVPYTIFRPTWFMESLPLFIQGGAAILIGRQPHRLRWLAAEDYARMVVRSYRTAEALGKELYIYGPEALTMREALGRYTAALAPRVRTVGIPLWLGAALASIGRSDELRATTALMRLTSQQGETGDPQLARTLLGTATTTLDQWLQQRAQRHLASAGQPAAG